VATARARSRKRNGAVLLAAVLVALPARGYETDQYSNRLEPIADSQVFLDAVVNRALAGVAARWVGSEDRLRFATEVWDQLGGLFWVDRIERLAMKSPEVERLPQHRWQSIYAGAPFWATRVGFFFGVGRTIRLAGSLLGSDKLGHFFSQGLKYYKSHLEGWSEERIAARGEFNERWLFGQWTTSVYSNADLVANWEGYRFYRSLFEDGIVPGKGPIVRFVNGHAEILRPFAWSDHVNDYWDEALNPSHWGPSLERAMHPKLETLCPEFARDPAAWVARDDAALARRYAGIGLRPAPENRLDSVCAHAAEDRRPGRARQR
jgi:hypothetical protein